MAITELEPSPEEIIWDPYKRGGSSYVIKMGNGDFLKFYPMKNHPRWTGVEIIGGYHRLQNAIAVRMESLIGRRKYPKHPRIQGVRFLKLPDLSDLEQGALITGGERICGVISRPEYVQGERVSPQVAYDIINATRDSCRDLMGANYTNHYLNFKLDTDGMVIVTDCSDKIYRTLTEHVNSTGGNIQLIEMCEQLGIDIYKGG